MVFSQGKDIKHLSPSEYGAHNNNTHTHAYIYTPPRRNRQNAGQCRRESRGGDLKGCHEVVRHLWSTTLHINLSRQETEIGNHTTSCATDVVPVQELTSRSRYVRAVTHEETPRISKHTQTNLATMGLVPGVRDNAGAFGHHKQNIHALKTCDAEVSNTLGGCDNAN